MAYFQSAVLKAFLLKVGVAAIEAFGWIEYVTEQKTKAGELKTQIAQTDKEIDAMVYELYGLSEEEVKVAEGGV